VARIHHGGLTQPLAIHPTTGEPLRMFDVSSNDPHVA
jgi:hypothetical protein